MGALCIKYFVHIQQLKGEPQNMHKKLILNLAIQNPTSHISIKVVYISFLIYMQSNVRRWSIFKTDRVFFNFIYSWILTYVLFLWKFCYLVYYFSGLLVAILSKKKCGIYKPMLRIRIYIDVIFKICCIFCFIYDNVLRDNTEFTFLSMM